MAAPTPLFHEAKSRYGGDDLHAMFVAATSLLERNVDAVNALNVFPVPDGDTGTNMFLTMRAISEPPGPAQGTPAGEVAATMARSALMEARGNSGVILSQFFKGMAVGIENTPDFGAEELARAFREAKGYAYSAVGQPVEGTILTVISSVAEAADAALANNHSVQELCEAVCAAARESVAQTPTMLDVLREAGVVDAGGQGLAVILEGVRRYVAGEPTEAGEIVPPAPAGVEVAAGKVSAQFLEATDEEVYGYCTQFLVQGNGLKVEAVRAEMERLAHSTVVVGDDTTVKVHVHADDPGQVLSVGVGYGTLARVSIQNMDEQHADFSADRRQDAPPAQVAVLPVALGIGLEVLFTNLGASGVVSGGNTMNPSVRDMVQAIESAPSDEVILLPNNGNIIPAAQQAADHSNKNVKVVATRSVPQGIAAILSFNPEREIEANVSDMEEAVSSVRTGEITEAVRAATLGGVEVRPGQLIGLLESKLVVAGDDLPGVATSLLEKAGASDGDLVTLYWGDRLTSVDVEGIEKHLAAAFPGLELEVVAGGQPDYHLLVSIE